MSLRNRYIYLLLFVFCCVNVMAQDVESLYSLAVSDYEKGLYEKAAERLEIIVKEHKDNTWADASYYLLGDIALKNKKTTLARSYFQTIISEYSKSPLVADSYYLIGKSYEMEKDYEKMIDIYRDFILKFPENYWIHEANQSLERYAQTRGEKVYKILYDIALEFHRKGMVTIAGDYYMNIVRNYPESPYFNASLYMVADMKYNSGDYNGALNFLSRIKKESDYYSRASFRRGDIYFYQKDYENAYDWYKQAYKNAIQGAIDVRADSLYMMAECDLINGNQERATKNLQLIVKLFPDSDWRYKAESTLSNIDSAYVSKSDIIPGVKSEKPEVDIRKQKLETISKLKDKIDIFNKDTSISSFKDSLSFSKNLEEAASYDRQKNYYEALNYYERASEYKEDNPDVLYRMGLLYNQMKDPETAVEKLKRYLKNNKGDDIILNYYAFLLYKLGKYDESIKAYQMAYDKQTTEREKEEIRLAIERVRMGKK